MDQPQEFPAPPLAAEPQQENPVTGVAEAPEEAAAMETLATQPAEPIQPTGDPAQAAEPEQPIGHPEQPAGGWQEPEPQIERDQPIAEPMMTASNTTSLLPPNAQGAAAKSHALYSHFIRVLMAARADIERYVPEQYLAAAEHEVAAMMRSLL